MTETFDHIFTDTATLYNNTSRNKFGDIDFGVGTSIVCSFRDVNDLDRNQNGIETLNSDAIIYIPTAVTVQKGDIIDFDGDFYRIERFINARRRFTNDDIMFKKGLLIRIRQVS